MSISSKPSNDDRIPVLFDTDIGSDVDDAVTLAYLLKQPRCELLGITTVTGEPQVRGAQLASALCQAFGRREVPIHSGTDRPLLVPPQQPEVPQRTVLTNWEHQKQFAPHVAVDFLRETIRSRPGEITLLSVGSLTNMALLFSIDPEIPTLLKRYVMMGGIYVKRLGRNEWNTKGDPHATAIVMAARVQEILCVGMDVTTRCRLPADECRRRFSKGPLKLVSEMAEVWFQKHHEITFHDPLAAACIFRPELCRFQPGRIEVQLQGGRPNDLTHFNPDAPAKPHKVALDVNPEAFFRHYFDTIEGD